MTLSFATVLTVLLLAGVGQDWERANANVRRLPPSAFQQLPARVVEHLRKRGCTVPQSFATTKPSGVIRGHFTSAKRLEWAVLCSVGQVSTVLVFRGGSVSTIDELARRPDSTFLQVVGPGNSIGFSRAIDVADPKHIRSRGGDSVAPPLDHDGIEDSFIEKGSTIWYWYDEQWRELPSAD
jgi:hypothetical protein